MSRREPPVLLREAARPMATALFLMLAAVGSACAVSGPEAIQDLSPTLPAEDGLTVADAELLVQISIIDEQVQGREQLLFEHLSTSQLDRGQLFQALSEASPGLELSHLFEAAMQLGPVASVQTDHERYVSYLRDIAVRSRSFERIVENDALVAMHQYLIEIMVARAEMVNEVSPRFCTTALVNVGEACESTEPPAGGDYGVALRTSFRRLGLQIGPRIGFFPAQYEQEELEAVTGDLLREVTGLLQKALESIQGLEPPPELRTVHERLIRFLSDSLAVLGAFEQEQQRLQRLNQLLEDFTTLTEEITRSFQQTIGSIRAREPRPGLQDIVGRIMRFLSENRTVLDSSEPGQSSQERLNQLLEDFATLTDETGNDLSPAAKAIVSPFFDEKRN